MGTLLVQQQDGIINVRLNRPTVRNAFNPDMISEMTAIFSELSSRHDVRVITLSGEGSVFCAGADLSWMKAMVLYSLDQNQEDALQLYEMFQAIATCSHPVVGLAHGAVFGGALGLLACCDYVLAEEETQFCFSEVKLGIVPAVISAFVRRKAVLGVTQPYMMSGFVFAPSVAMQMGLVHGLVPKGKGLEAVSEVALRWKDAGPEAVRATKKLLCDLPNLTEADLKTRTTKLIAERRVSTEGQEGLKSFLEKRSPQWRDQ